MNSKSLNYYTIVLIVITLIFISTIIKAFIDLHPLRFIFIILFAIGLIVGYFRYLMRVRKEQAKSSNWFKKIVFVLLFVLIYVSIKGTIKEVIITEVSTQDYGVVIAFFFLGLFIAYYGFYSYHLWKFNKLNKVD